LFDDDDEDAEQSRGGFRGHRGGFRGRGRGGRYDRLYTYLNN